VGIASLAMPHMALSALVSFKITYNVTKMLIYVRTPPRKKRVVVFFLTCQNFNFFVVFVILFYVYF
jgi:hypothetical protein